MKREKVRYGLIFNFSILSLSKALQLFVTRVISPTKNFISEGLRHGNGTALEL
jgi:hypothetical protein